MRFGYIDQSLKNDWEHLVEKTPQSGFMQSFFWTAFTNLLGWPTFKIGVFDDNKLIGGAVVSKFTESNGSNYLYIPQGPVLPYNHQNADKIFNGLIAEIDNVADLKGQHLTSHLRIDPKLTTLAAFFNRFRKAPYDPEARRTLLIDLSLPLDEILQQMKPKGRYNIKVAKRYGLRVISSDVQSGLREFLTFYHKTVNRKQFEGKNEDYFVKLTSILKDSPHAKFYFVKDGDDTLAVALLIFYGPLVTFLFGASSDIKREKMAPYLLHFEIISQAKALGYLWYDFYGLAPDENDPTHPWQGFTQFKKKFGGQEAYYIGAYDFVYNEKLYLEYLKNNREI